MPLILVRSSGAPPRAAARLSGGWPGRCFFVGDAFSANSRAAAAVSVLAVAWRSRGWRAAARGRGVGGVKGGGLGAGADLGAGGLAAGELLVAWTSPHHHRRRLHRRGRRRRQKALGAAANGQADKISQRGQQADLQLQAGAAGNQPKLRAGEAAGQRAERRQDHPPAGEFSAPSPRRGREAHQEPQRAGGGEPNPAESQHVKHWPSPSRAYFEQACCEAALISPRPRSRRRLALARRRRPARGWRDRRQAPSAGRSPPAPFAWRGRG